MGTRWKNRLRCPLIRDEDGFSPPCLLKSAADRWGHWHQHVVPCQAVCVWARRGPPSRPHKAPRQYPPRIPQRGPRETRVARLRPSGPPTDPPGASPSLRARWRRFGRRADNPLVRPLPRDEDDVVLRKEFHYYYKQKPPTCSPGQASLINRRGAGRRPSNSRTGRRLSPPNHVVEPRRSGVRAAGGCRTRRALGRQVARAFERSRASRYRPDICRSRDDEALHAGERAGGYRFSSSCNRTCRALGTQDNRCGPEMSQTELLLARSGQTKIYLIATAVAAGRIVTEQ